MQLIVLTETRSGAQTDWAYVRAFLHDRYDIRGKVKLTPIFLETKSKYCKKEREIRDKIGAYASQRAKYSGEDITSIVVVCLDSDYGKNTGMSNDDIACYCRQKGFELVWFHRDVEEVFLGRSVSEKEKVKESEKFCRDHLIHKLDMSRLASVDITKSVFGRSNLKSVFDRLLLS